LLDLASEAQSTVSRDAVDDEAEDPLMSRGIVGEFRVILQDLLDPFVDSTTLRPSATTLSSGSITESILDFDDDFDPDGLWFGESILAGSDLGRINRNGARMEVGEVGSGLGVLSVCLLSLAGEYPWVKNSVEREYKEEVVRRALAGILM